MEYIEKKHLLLKNIRRLVREGLAVAFSGGVDSSLLLTLCCEAANKTPTAAETAPADNSSGIRPDVSAGSRATVSPPVFAVTFQTRLHPAADLEIARRAAKAAGAEHVVLSTDELYEAGIYDNPPDRCYRCKRLLFQKLSAFAREQGLRVLLDGTNADDLTAYRPGLRALGELGVLSPLADAGFTKEDVRRMAAEYGLPVANRPSAPCLATRFPYGTKLDYDLLRKVDEAEGRLRELGFSTVRIRIHRDIARLEIEPADMPRALSLRQEILSCVLSTGVDYAALDLAGFRSGSMDLHVK